jgi:DNA-binding transcriptional regulator YdaS (Cro superfamily)
MDLREYMFHNRLSNKNMAEILDCSIPQIILVRRGKRVSKKFARQLEKATNGQITATEVVTEIIPLSLPEKENPDDKKENVA